MIMHRPLGPDPTKITPENFFKGIRFFRVIDGPSCCVYVVTNTCTCVQSVVLLGAGDMASLRCVGRARATKLPLTRFPSRLSRSGACMEWELSAYRCTYMPIGRSICRVAYAGFMAQFGIHGKPAKSQLWKERTLKDDPVVESNKRGYRSQTQHSLSHSHSQSSSH